MTIILGLDVGDKRVGLAISDTSGRIATPLRAVERAKGEAERAIKDIVEDKGISTVVVGMPLLADGTRSEQCEKIENFCRRLSRRIDVKLEFVDEFLSSEEARERLGIKGSPPRQLREKGVIDSMSASIILQSFIDAHTDK